MFNTLRSALKRKNLRSLSKRRMHRRESLTETLTHPEEVAVVAMAEVGVFVDVQVVPGSIIPMLLSKHKNQGDSPVLLSTRGSKEKENLLIEVVFAVVTVVTSEEASAARNKNSNRTTQENKNVNKEFAGSTTSHYAKDSTKIEDAASVGVA